MALLSNSVLGSVLMLEIYQYIQVVKTFTFSNLELNCPFLNGYLADFHSASSLKKSTTSIFTGVLANSCGSVPSLNDSNRV